MTMTKGQMILRCREILSRTEDGAKMDMYDEGFVMSVLETHPEASTKIKPRMRITVGHNRFGTRSFYLLYEDGTRDDFSFYKCQAPHIPT